MAEQIRVMLVEDDKDIQLIVQMSLALSPEFVVTCFDSAFSALFAARRGGRFDLFLLDVNLIDGNGLALLAELRACAGLGTVPAIFLTVSAGVAATETYLQAGAIGVIAKPFDPVNLAEQIRSLIDGS